MGRRTRVSGGEGPPEVASLLVADRFPHTAELDDGDSLLLPGEEIQIYFNLLGKFVKQRARVDVLLAMEPSKNEPGKTLVRIERTGEPESAEKRQCYRVSTIFKYLTIAFGGSSNCPFVDVSPTGFAVISPEKYEIGSIVTATPAFEDQKHTGQVRIQSVREVSEGRYRYGVHCVDRQLEAVVQKISMALQREQLRRISGRA